MSSSRLLLHVFPPLPHARLPQKLSPKERKTAREERKGNTKIQVCVRKKNVEQFFADISQLWMKSLGVFGRNLKFFRGLKWW
jgi:hypothetical protein